MPVVQPVRVLLCIAADDIRARCAEELRVRGFFVDEVTSGKACVSQALSSKLDAVVVDTTLDDLDGYEVARRIRTEDTRRRVRLIGLATLSTASDVTRSRNAGFDLLVSKPVRVEQLVVAMQTLKSMKSSSASARRAN